MGDAGEENVVLRLEPVPVVMSDAAGGVPEEFPAFGFHEPPVGGACRCGPGRGHEEGGGRQVLSDVNCYRRRRRMSSPSPSPSCGGLRRSRSE